MELLCADISRSRYLQLVEQQQRLVQQAGQAKDALVSGQTPEGGFMNSRQKRAASKRSKEASQRNEMLERFKFWLGLPNTYYNPPSD
jgi:hypothetical protein